MKIEAFLLCWNEIDIMPFVVKHYQKFCDRIVIYDNHSTDGSSEIAKSLGCEVIPFGSKFFDDSENMKVKNSCWKGSNADWVIVADFDECLFSYYVDTVMLPIESWWNDIQEKLLIEKEEQQSTIIRTIGWQIMSNEMPKEDLLEITNGYRFDNYSKNIIFNPKAIQEINYNPGAHRCDPVGDVVWSEESLYVLHYKHIGGVERTIKRYKEYQKRMSPYNRKHGHGRHYNQNERLLRREWAERIAKSKSLI